MKLLRENIDDIVLKKFLSSNAALINDGEIAKLYDEAPVDLYEDLTELLLNPKVDINPLL